MQQQNGKDVGERSNSVGRSEGVGDDEYCIAETCSSFAGFKEGGTVTSWEAFDARPLLPKGMLEIQRESNESLTAREEFHFRRQ